MTEHLSDAWAALADALGYPIRLEQAREIASAIPLGPGPDGRTALAMAAAAGADEIGLLLLERGADPLFALEGDWTPLRKASLSGSATLVRALIAHGALVGREGEAALEAALASFERHRRVAADPDRGLATVATLLDAGVDPHSPGVTDPASPIVTLAGRVLLLRRIRPELHARVLDELVRRGVALDAIFDHALEDALCQVARVWEDPILADYLDAHGLSSAGRDGRGTILHGLASRDTPREAFERWIARGARLEARDASGMTPLLVAAASAAPRSVEALVAVGAIVSATDAQGRNAATLASARIGADALLRWLEERGVQAAPTTQDPEGPPPAAVPAGALPARVIDGTFKGFDAHVTLGPDGRYDAVVSIFGRGVSAILGPSELSLLEP